jgi:hypothetical protein
MQRTAGNCGATEGLLRCGRCKHAYFCSRQCQKVNGLCGLGSVCTAQCNVKVHHMIVTQAYWPMHKSACRVNDFAAALEAREPRFAAWMRNHGKQAVIQARSTLSPQPPVFLHLMYDEAACQCTGLLALCSLRMRRWSGWTGLHMLHVARSHATRSWTPCTAKPIPDHKVGKSNFECAVHVDHDDHDGVSDAPGTPQ